MKVMIAEAYSQELNETKSALRRCGFETYTANTTIQTLRKFKSVNPDVILIDLDSVSIDALEIIYYINSIKNDYPIIVTSRSNNNPELLYTIHNKISDFILKPIAFGNFKNRISKAIHSVEDKCEFEMNSTPSSQQQLGIMVPCYA